MDNLQAFLEESNRIEGIPVVTDQELEEARRFLRLDVVTIADLISFVKATQPDAVLRDRPGLNVRVGKHVPPESGSRILAALDGLLFRISGGMISPYRAHVEYEVLHPFTDGNGRSGRILWLWQMETAPLGFLHAFYYQALAAHQE